MFESKDNLQDLINFVNGQDKKGTIIKRLVSISIVGILAASGEVGTLTSTIATLGGTSVSKKIEELINFFKVKSIEDISVENLKRCQFVDITLVKLATVYTLSNTMDPKNRFFAKWKIKQLEEDFWRDFIEKDEIQEDKLFSMFDPSKDGQSIKQDYFEETINAITKVIDIDNNQCDDFKNTLRSNINMNYSSFQDQILNSSDIYNTYSESKSNRYIQEKIEELLIFVASYKTFYFSIKEIDDYLIQNTRPSISLNFFDYNDQEFEDALFNSIKTEKYIHIEGKSREEATYYVLYLLKERMKERISEILIVNSYENWGKLEGQFSDKILIANFNSGENLSVIPNNVNIFFYGENDFKGKNTIVLPQRLLENMREKLNNEIKDIHESYELVSKSRGVYAVFKRLIFQGKSAKPSWENDEAQKLIPALLINSWELNEKDQQCLEKLAGIPYEKYWSLLNIFIGREDPFIIKNCYYSKEEYSVANLEEAWEVLKDRVTLGDLENFKTLAIDVFREVPLKYKEPVEKHFMGDLLSYETEYSSSIKRGILNTLIMLSLNEGKLRNLRLNSTQLFVDQIVKEILGNVKCESDWYSISEYLTLFVEASPKEIIKLLEENISDDQSTFWVLFKNTDNSLWGRNYYTHVLSSLEIMLHFKDLAMDAIAILVKLCEKDFNYKITNSPKNTLSTVLLPWIHQINISLDEKCEIVEFILENSWEVGWGILERILPSNTPGQVAESIKHPKYKEYKLDYVKMESSQISEMKKKFLEIAIKFAGNHLTKWMVIFSKLTFFNYNLGKKVLEGALKAVENTKCDETKYKFKELIREKIYKNRYYCVSGWAEKEENIRLLEQDLFEKITFKNVIYDYLYLFDNDYLIELHPTPYSKDKDNFTEGRLKLQNERTKALEILIKDNGILEKEIIKYIDQKNYWASTFIGEILAKEYHLYEMNIDFLIELISNDYKMIYVSYISTIYMKKGTEFLQELLPHIKENEEWLLETLNIFNIDMEFLEKLKSLESSKQELFWCRGRFKNICITDQVLESVWAKLISSKNFSAAMFILNKYWYEDSKRIILLLDEISKSDESYQGGQEELYLIIDFFERIYRMPFFEPHLMEYNKIINLEFIYYNIFDDRLKPLYLIHLLKTDPDVCSKLINMKFKFLKEESLSEAERTMGKKANNILKKLKFCPFEFNGNINEDDLDSWVQKFIENVTESGYVNEGKNYLGACLAEAPSGPDGEFPQKVIVKMFQKYFCENLNAGFVNAIIYSRGVFAVTQGAEELKLSKTFEQYARPYKIKHSKMYQSLMYISQYYLSNSVEDRAKGTVE